MYRVDDLPGAAANTATDQRAGLAYLNVVSHYMAEPGITVHEFGHAMTYAATWWVDQTRTGAWWETVAQFVADTYMTAPVCAASRAAFGQSEGTTLVDLKKVLGDSHQVIVDGTKNSGNYYQAWPFLTYLFNNPDDYAGLRNQSVFPAAWTRYKRGSGETPLHVLERIVLNPPGGGGAVRIQDVVGRYWARMAFVDIGHKQAAKLFATQRRSISYANVDAVVGAAGPAGATTYRAKAARQPRYMGANIVPLKVAAGTVAVNVTAAGGAALTATLAVRTGAAVRYVNLDSKTGFAEAAVAAGDEAALVVVNTPDPPDPLRPLLAVGRGQQGPGLPGADHRGDRAVSHVEF